MCTILIILNKTQVTSAGVPICNRYTSGKCCRKFSVGLCKAFVQLGDVDDNYPADWFVVMQLLMPVYPGQMRYIRKNLYNAVYIIDPALPSGLKVGCNLSSSRSKYVSLKVFRSLLRCPVWPVFVFDLGLASVKLPFEVSWTSRLVLT